MKPVATILMPSFLTILVDATEGTLEISPTTSKFNAPYVFPLLNVYLCCLAKTINKAMLLKVKNLLDMNVLCDYLMEYGVVRSGEDMKLISSPHYSLEDKIASLVKTVEKEGSRGWAKFWIALEKSANIRGGHKEAMELLKHHGK